MINSPLKPEPGPNPYSKTILGFKLLETFSYQSFLSFFTKLSYTNNELLFYITKQYITRCGARNVLIWGGGNSLLCPNSVSAPIYLPSYMYIARSGSLNSLLMAVTI